MFLEILRAEACNFIKKEALAQVFSCEFCEISKDTFQDTAGRLLVSLLARAPFIYRLHDYFQLAYMRCKFQLNLFKPC